uniref:Uncharacterized protein n=1 Tax=Hordeum vulgare subsp. vulgare TaxID=112509 RepID=A0A8I6WB73_HORVV
MTPQEKRRKQLCLPTFRRSFSFFVQLASGQFSCGSDSNPLIPLFSYFHSLSSSTNCNCKLQACMQP